MKYRSVSYNREDYLHLHAVRNYKENKSFNYIRNAILRLVDFFYPLFKSLMPIQTYRYLACGGTTTILGLFGYFIAYNFIVTEEYVSFLGFHVTQYIAAYIISFLISFPIGFFLSKFVVFQESVLKGRIQLFRYLILQFLNIVINWSLLHFFVGWLGFWATPSQALSAIIIAVFSYFFQRNVSFKINSSLDNNIK